MPHHLSHLGAGIFIGDVPVVVLEKTCVIYKLFVKSEFAQAQKNLHLQKSQPIRGTFQPSIGSSQLRLRGWRGWTGSPVMNPLGLTHCPSVERKKILVSCYHRTAEREMLEVFANRSYSERN